MSDIVLVHGAWHGGWCWQRVIPYLLKAGHRVHAITLNGVGDRAHQLSPTINLDSHLTDVLSLIAAEELQSPILVGHSYGGVVITGVADRLMAAHASNSKQASVERLVYVDAILPLPGESWSSTQTPETIKARTDAAMATPMKAIPPPDASAFGLTGADADWANRRQRPQPLGTYLQPLQFDIARVSALPRHYIDCVKPPSAGIAPSRLRVRDPNFWGGGWRLTELATGHDAMVSEPEQLAGLILKLH
jgi:pimeloyl-ACP methyl ester carboxylesterase